MPEQTITRHHSLGKTLAIIILAIVALAAGVAVWQQLTTPPLAHHTDVMETKHATLLPQLKALQPFTLKDQHGQPFTHQSLSGQWTFINFGYTHCPDICPTTLAMLTNMDERLHTIKPTTPYQIAFVSIDPERDTQQRLAEYIDYFDPSFLAATGSDDELQGLTQPLGIMYAKVATEKSAMGYVMDHSASIILVDPEGRYYALFSPPHDARIMADDFITISENY